MRCTRIITVISLLSLTACGGDSQETTAPLPANTVVETVNVNLSGNNGTSLLSAQQIQGAAKVGRAVVNSRFANAIGTLRHASSGTSVQGNLTLGVTAADSDELTKVSIYLPSVNKTLTLCSANCAANYQATITGFSPQLAGASAGALRIELVVEDGAGNSVVVDALNLNWQPLQISAVNATRENDVISVSWSGNSSLNRYNVYAATQSGLDASNALNLDNGFQQLAINATSVQFPDVDPSKDYHILVTGIDGGGESGLSSLYTLPRVDGTPNQAPNAVNDNLIVNEDEVLSVNVLDNDSDPEGQLLRFVALVSAPANGKVVIDEQGNLTYNPDINFFGKDSFSYQIEDSEGATSEAVVIIEVSPVNDNPIAIADFYGVDTQGNLDASTTNLLANDTDIGGDALTIVTEPVEAPAIGVLIINADGSFSYQTDEALAESVQFVYQVVDENGGTANATVTILAGEDIQAPIAQNDAYQVDEDNTLVIDSVSLGLLGNDSDPNNLSFSLAEVLVSAPEHGQLNVSLDGTFTYIPDSDFFGVDQFQYQIYNAGGVFVPAMVTLTVNPLPDVPVALNDNFQTLEDAILQLDSVTGLLANDVDLDKGALRINTTPLTAPLKGSLILAEDGSFTYTPEADFNGIDSFTYQLVSENNLTSSANVNITVEAVNDAPTVINDNAVVDEDSDVMVDVLANDTDKEGDNLILTSVDIEEGTALIVNNSISVTPAADFFGELSINYSVADNFGASSEGLLIVTVSPINDPPLANNDSYLSDEDKVLNVSVSHSQQLLSNDIDVDGDVLTVNTTPISNVSNGSLTLNSNGSFVYTPSIGFIGIDSFTYQISDASGEVSQANVTLTIADLNDVPVAVADSYTVVEDNTLTITNVAANHLLVNDTDPEGATLSVYTTPITDVSNGSLTLNNDGSFVYVPTADFSGIDSFAYRISDGNGGSAQANVTITVSAVNDAPVASPDLYSLNEDSILNIQVTDANQLLSNDNDADGDSLTVSLVTNVTQGSLILNGDGSFSYTPNADFNGADAFTYEINDGNGGTDQASVDLTILAVNDAPVAANQTFSINEDKTHGDVVDTVIVTDKESDTLSFALTAGDTNLFNINASTGIITINGVKPLDYETNTQHTITVTISDDGTPSAESSDITVTINVSDVVEAGVFNEVASFGRPAIGFLELTGVKAKAKLIDSATKGSKLYFVGEIDNLDKDIYLIAYNKDGTLDNSFGSGGKASFDFGHDEYARGIVEEGGKFYITFTSDNGTFTEVCFIKIDDHGDLITGFGSNGIRCTTEQSTLAINDSFYSSGDIFAVGKVQGSDDDLLIIQIDNDGVFIDHTPADTNDSPHIIRDVSGSGLNDEGFAIYNPKGSDIMVAGHVMTAAGDTDMFAWLLDKDGDAINSFNGGNPKLYDISTTDDKVNAIGGKRESNYTAHLVGSTVIGGNKEAAIIAINKTGALETSFGTNGIATYDVDLGAGNAEFTGIDYHDEELYLSGTLFDGQNKPFASRVFEADGAIDSVNFGDANGYRKISYATDNAFALGMSLDGDETMWLPGYVESGADTNMIISAVDKDGILCNKDCKFDFSDGMQTFTHSSVASNDNASEIIQINAGVHASKFLLAAVANDGTNDQVVLTRLTAAGALDTSFSDDGHKQIQIGTSALVNGLFELPSGKFIVYGNVTEGADVDGFIARLDNNGNLDSTFANNGIYTTTAISASTIEFSQAAIDSNGNIVAVGQIDNSSNSSFIIRLDGSGQLDTSFNSIGYRIGSNTDEYLSLLIDSNNDIYAAGSRLDTDKEMLIVKYANTGALDTSFSGDGILTIDVNASSDDYATRVLFDSSNDLYIIGNNFAAQQQVSVVKISPSGGLDTSFDGDGVASFIMAPLLANAGVTDAVIDNNDNVVVVGFGQLLGTNAGMIGRIKPNGSLDTSFTLFGFYSVTSCANTAQLESVILLNNSSLVVAGQCYINASSKNNIELSQYQLD